MRRDGPVKKDATMLQTLTTLQTEPHLVMEWNGPPTHILVMALWDEDLPSDMSLSCCGRLFRFRTREERMQWTLGVQCVLDNITTPAS